MRVVDGAIVDQIKQALASEIEYLSSVVLAGAIGTDDLSAVGSKYIRAVGRLEALKSFLGTVIDIENGALGKDDE